MLIIYWTTILLLAQIFRAVNRFFYFYFGGGAPPLAAWFSGARTFLSAAASTSDGGLKLSSVLEGAKPAAPGVGLAFRRFSPGQPGGLPEGSRRSLGVFGAAISGQWRKKGHAPLPGCGTVSAPLPGGRRPQQTPGDPRLPSGNPAGLGRAAGNPDTFKPVAAGQAAPYVDLECARGARLKGVQ